MMGNTSIILAENIQKYRKRSGLTQEEVANKLGVTFQAVSKWENGKSAPDIMFLPRMAELFGCSIDTFFSKETDIDIPWEDDDVIRVFQAQGRKIIKTQDDRSYIEVTFPRNCNETTRQYFKVEVFGNIVCDSSINGDVICHGNISCYEINGDVSAESVTVKGKKEDIVTPFTELSAPADIKEYVSKQLKEQVDNSGSTNKLLSVIADNIDGNFPLTDENIERLLDAYRDFYKGMQNK